MRGRTASVSAITVSAAVPAAADTGLALNVPGCAIFSRPARAVTLKSSRSRMSLRPATHAPGSPPATILAKLDRSGRTSNAICAPPLVARKPVTTSSKISSTPCCVHSRRSSWANSAPSGTWPNDEPVGS